MGICRCLLLLLLLLPLAAALGAEISVRREAARPGCLFHRELCSSWEVCVNDGFYGSCQQRAGGAAMRPSKRELPALHGITRTLSPPPASPVGGAPPPATPAVRFWPPPWALRPLVGEQGGGAPAAPAAEGPPGRAGALRRALWLLETLALGDRDAAATRLGHGLGTREAPPRPLPQTPVRSEVPGPERRGVGDGPPPRSRAESRALGRLLSAYLSPRRHRHVPPVDGGWGAAVGGALGGAVGGAVGGPDPYPPRRVWGEGGAGGRYPSSPGVWGGRTDTRVEMDPVRAALEAELSFYGLSLSDLSPAQVATLVAVVTDGQGGRPGPPVAVETGGGRQGPPPGPNGGGVERGRARGGPWELERLLGGGPHGYEEEEEELEEEEEGPEGGPPPLGRPLASRDPAGASPLAIVPTPAGLPGGGVPGGGGPTEGGGATSLEYGYVVADHDPLSVRDGLLLMEALSHNLGISLTSFTDVNVIGPALAFQIGQNEQNLSVSSIAEAAVRKKAQLEKDSGVRIIQMGVGEQRSGLQVVPRLRRGEQPSSRRLLALSVVLASCAGGVLAAGAVLYCLRRRRGGDKGGGAGGHAGGTEPSADYQELCRQRMAARCAERGEGVPPAPAHGSRVSSVSSQQSDAAQRSPSSRSSSSSWCEEPVASTMDISTGHMVLAYMEDHLSNKERLSREWESLCSEQADPAVCTVALAPQHAHKNRTAHSTPYDHARIVLKADVNPSHSDYINASPIMDHDPRSPSYIATQGPLPHTVADFWQMVWEQGCVVLVMLTPLSENGVRQCQRYWPDEGSNLYHIYEVNLVSEHIWCEDFLVRSFYLKNIRSGETRTLTQFHFLSWPDHAVPASTRSLLDFRRKVNKCYRGRSCPIIIHCSDGAGRTGTYLLIDMVLNRMAKGTKEIDIAATLEHIRDQRAGMVRTKEQFEFALTALAEEVNAILKSLPK
ncbi:receptor-type tyrosine-protein phosphatase N2-like [Lethenteron reissneri]|uniref:receptor-type tyrosine-protein phosphatase N2-like n=1 Tax=Lethenteron reissneri TaxID=7753 RepID=UPI002AB7C233|nr:receptor-type tyrosine-protein phosphatase N2-like [Lethenteron reissneri]